MDKNLKRKHLLRLIEEATVDCYDQHEQHSGLLTMIADRVACPFHAKVIGEDVKVIDFAWPKGGYGLLAVCERNGRKYEIDVNSLEWVEPYPDGFEWIEAHQLWRKEFL
jgi:hypothetical protein